MDTLLCKDDGAIVFGTNEPSNTLLRLSADQYTAGDDTWADQSGNGLDFTVSTNKSLKGTDADGFPYMDFNGTYGSATRGSNIPAPTSTSTSETRKAYTIFCVTRIRPGTGYRSLMFGSGDIQLIVLDGNLGLYNSRFIDSGFDVTEDMTNSRNLLVVELSQTEPMFKFKLNESGTDSIINSSENFAIPFNTIGTNGNNYWGNVYEFIVYDGVLGASERDFVAEYLAYKWAISSKLPSLITTQGLIRNEETLAFLYTGSGTETTYTWDAEGVTYADVLIVGGGGGGGTPRKAYEPGGGGGGGEVVLRQGVAVTPGVEIKVGGGGPASTQGGISQFTSSIQANGGGRGGGSPGVGGGDGGSGGGAPRAYTAYPNGNSVKLSADGLGNVGGYNVGVGAGGGGGATEAGEIVTTGTNEGTDGGEGYAATVFGVWNTVYGSGGGGGARSGANGLGGTNAGNGGNHTNSIPPQPGIAHRGGGGGGAGTGVAALTPPGGAGGSGIVLVKPNPGALDGLGMTIYTQAVGAYALRRLFGAYTGPQVRLRRSTDNTEVDVTFDKYGHPVNFDVGGWLGGGTAYVTTWYDQSGEDNDLTQTNVTYQPKYDTTNKIEFIASSQHSLLRTPGVLAAGDDTYTFAGVFEPHATGTQVVCEQNSSTSIGSQRACVILTSGKIGHNGQSNDAHNIVAYTLNQKNRFVMRVNNGVSPNIKLNHEGTNYTATSTNPSTLNVSGYGFSIGYKLSNNSEYYDGFISEIIVFNTEISDTETNAIISLAHAIKNGPGVIPPLPLALQLGALDDLGVSLYNTAVGAYALRRLFGAYTGPQVRLRRSTDDEETDVYFSSDGFTQLNLTTWLEGGTGYIVTWYDQGPNATHTTAYGTSATTFPSIYEREDGLYAVYFPGSSATVGGHFNAGSVTFNVATNGGVSTFSRVNLLGANVWERVYDYGNGQSDNNLVFARNNTSTTSVLGLRQGSTNKGISVSNGIVNNTWQSFGNRVQGSGGSWVFTTRKDGTETTGGAQAITYTDRTITNSYIGRSNWSVDEYSNMYLSCQIFFNTGAITSQQFAVMENTLF